MLGKFPRLGRRQLHTIISREIIKPSSPTASHLLTYYLSELDQLNEHKYMPIILLYPNNGNCNLTADHKSLEMKKSLSRSLTHYYPFAGRLSKPSIPYIDCNDEGVVFLEAKTDTQLDQFLKISELDETKVHYFSDGQVWHNSPRSTSLLGVQLNHFSCGGIGLAVSMSHIIADACTLASFLSHWASVARYGSTDHKEVLPLNPNIIHYPRTNSIQPEEAQVIDNVYTERVMKKFVFRNSKLRDLKNKVIAMATSGSILHRDNPTRVEVLSSLLYKTAVAAATTKSGCFKPSCLIIPVDVRKKFVQKLPQTTMGNFASAMMVQSRHSSETSLNVVVAEIKKEKLKNEGLESVQRAAENFKLLLSKLGNGQSYWCSSVCGFHYHNVDFGWGKPIGGITEHRSLEMTGFLLVDAPDGDGIEALVSLEKEDMEIFMNDKEIISFCEMNHV